MKNSKQAGFSIVEMLLIVLIVGMVGFTGWYVWNSKQIADKTNSQAVSDSQASNTSSSQGWKTYSAKLGKFTIKYPSDWKLTDNRSNDDPAVSPQENAKFVAPDGANVWYSYSLYSPSLPEISDFIACGHGSVCDNDYVYTMQSFNSGSKFGKVYTVLDKGRGLDSYAVYLYKPRKSADLPKIGVNSIPYKMYAFSMYDSKRNSYFISATLPDKYNKKTSQEVQNSEDYKTIIKIMQSFQSL